MESKLDMSLDDIIVKNEPEQKNKQTKSRRDRSSRASPYDSKSSGNRQRGRDRDNRGGGGGAGVGVGVGVGVGAAGGAGYERHMYYGGHGGPASYAPPQFATQPYPLLNNNMLVNTSPLMRKVIKVSAKSNVKSVAGAISHTTRAGESPTIVATGSESVNQAIKALAIARGYLSENKLDISVQPVFRNQEKGALSFVLTKSVLRAKKAGDDDIQELRVAKGSDPNSVAGSIANKVRAGERVVILSIGAGSVNQTVRAVALARRFLEGDAIDVCFRPEFIHIKLDDGERSAIKFVILAQQI